MSCLIKIGVSISNGKQEECKHNKQHDEKIVGFVTVTRRRKFILKNKQYPQASRLRVNMGNIYFEQKKFD